MASSRFLFTGGVVLHNSDVPSVSTFLQSNPGAYTTSRTHNNGSCVLFWDRHLRRLADSARILFSSSTSAFSLPVASMEALGWELIVGSLVDNAVKKVLPVALEERESGEELAITTLVSGDWEKLRDIGNVDDGVLGFLDVQVHVGGYVPLVFGVQENAANLAVVGGRRDVAEAKCSDWVRIRKPLEKLRPPSVTELLLSNDGDQMLEGSITNFFVVCHRDRNEAKGKYLNDFNSACNFEVQTAPISDGILPGVIRQLVIEVCLSKGIPLREVSPSWSRRETWEEAFITNSLRLLQHVETIQVPSTWESLGSKTWKDISWKEKRFEEGPGMITRVIQKEIVDRAGMEGYPLRSFM